MKQLMPRSAYAEAVRAMYDHPFQGDPVFAIAPDTRRSRRKQPRIRPGTEAERPFIEIWRAAPLHTRAWALGRMAARYPRLAVLLDDDALTDDMWKPLTRRTCHYAAAESQAPRHSFSDGSPRYTTDAEGNLVDRSTGNLADLTG